MKSRTALMIAACAALVSTSSLAADPAAKRAEIRKMCDEAVAALIKAKPEMKQRIDGAPGYGCFTSFGMSFFVGGAGGSGLVHDRAAKKDIYMNMGAATGGLDFGVKSYREVLVFKDSATLKKFVESGWEFGGGASATAKAGGKGAGGDAAEVTSGPIEVYPITSTGLALGVAAGARKYWKDKDLN
jgi:lipid-binding SYLF domain-containing protein